jgi:hypothetical protein
MLRAIFTVLMLAVPVAASANDFKPIKDRDDFLSLVKDRELRIGLYNLSLNVLPDGQIKGAPWDGTSPGRWRGRTAISAARWTGAAWKSNTTASWSRPRVPSGCAFTVDKGTGDSATFKLR